MRRIALACSFLGSLLAAGCAPTSGHDADGRVSETQAAIAFGTQDTAHTAVVALLAPGTGGSFSECSGSIVKIANGQAYVLTAAHCCKDGAPTVVVRSTDYSVGENYIFGGTPQPPAYPVVPGSAYWDTAYNNYDHDFCMLKFSGASSTWPTLALPSASQCSPSLNDGVANGVSVEHVGFGMTNTNQNNSTRMTGTDKITSFDNTTISYSQGGTAKIPGPCEGDSGGPALIAAGAAQSSQTIVAVTSFGMTQSCGAQDTGTSSRVCSEIGSNKFITNFLNDTPSGAQAGMMGTDCNSCQTSAQNGACANQTSACANDPKCVTLSQCYGNCTTQACYTTCQTQAGTQAVNELTNYSNCICNTGCPTECATECGGSTSSSSSSSGGGNCGLQSSDATCNSCLVGSCCSQGVACANDSTCVGCLTNQTAACNSNAAFAGIVNCLSTHCATPCGISTSSSSSSSSSSGGTSTSSSGGGSSSGILPTGSSSSSSGGAMSSGAMSGAGGAGGGSDGNGNNTQESGCSVGTAGSETSSSASIAGMLLGLAIAASRRRRAS